MGSEMCIRDSTTPDRWMLGWYAAYLLPEHHILPLSHVPPSEHAPYALSLEEPWDDPRWKHLETFPGAWLYQRTMP